MIGVKPETIEFFVIYYKKGMKNVQIKWKILFKKEFLILICRLIFLKI